MRRSVTSWKFAFAIAAAGAIALGTAAAASAGAQQLTEQLQQPQFSAAVARVLVDVTVVDDRGRFVSDLSIDDFSVFEEGRQMEIELFALERFREVIPWTEGEDGDTALPPAADNAPVLPRYLVFFIDGFNTAPNHWEMVRYALNDYIRNELQPNDRILLATLTPRRKLMVAPDFSRDVESLTRMIDSIVTNPYIDHRERQNEQELLRALYEDAVTGAPVFDVEEGANPVAEANRLRHGANLAQVFAGERKEEIIYTLDAMTSLAGHLSRTFDVPGPKTMVMVSSGIAQTPGSGYFYILDERLDEVAISVRMDSLSAAEHPVAFRTASAQTIEAYLMRAVGRLNRLNYTLYTIGARGMGSALAQDISLSVRSNLSIGTRSIIFRDQQEGLRALASGTGGLAFDNSANFKAAFAQVDRDTAFRYVLGYTPPERAEDVSPDEFYRIRVEVERDDVKVRSRRGYVEG